MNAFRELGLFVAWLAGSLGGITAIFYACGYLITLSNLKMLGLDLLAFNYDPAFYMQRGAGFVVLCTVSLVHTLIGYSILVILVVPLFLLARWAAGRSRLTKHADGIAQAILANGTQWRAVAFTLMLLAMAIFIMHLYPSIQEHLAVLDVLMEGPRPGTSDVQTRVRGWIIDGNRAPLESQFAIFVQSLLIAAVIVIAAWRVTQGWAWRPLWMAPFVLLFGIAAASLPLAYGVLMLPNEFSEVVLIRDEGQASERPTRLYLLNKNADEFVLWEPVERRILWIPTHGLSAVAILGRRSLREIRGPIGRREQ